MKFQDHRSIRDKDHIFQQKWGVFPSQCHVSSIPWLQHHRTGPTLKSGYVYLFWMSQYPRGCTMLLWNLRWFLVSLKSLPRSRKISLAWWVCSDARHWWQTPWHLRKCLAVTSSFGWRIRIGKVQGKLRKSQISVNGERWSLYRIILRDPHGRVIRLTFKLALILEYRSRYMVPSRLCKMMIMFDGHTHESHRTWMYYNTIPTVPRFVENNIYSSPFTFPSDNIIGTVTKEIRLTYDYRWSSTRRALKSVEFSMSASIDRGKLVTRLSLFRPSHPSELAQQFCSKQYHTVSVADDKKYEGRRAQSELRSCWIQKTILRQKSSEEPLDRSWR